MRKITVLVAAALGVLVLAAVALAADSSIDYSSKLTQTGKAKGPLPSNIGYNGTLDVNGVPQGNQPDVAPKTVIFFDKALVTNGKYFPSTCTKADIDGIVPTPAKCAKSQIGSGTAKAVGGNPGEPQSPALSEDLTVKAYNAAKGKQILLVIFGTSPIGVPNRVITGTLGPGGGKYGYTVTFVVPPDLQQQLGTLPVALTHFSVDIPGTAPTKTAKVPTKVKVKVKGKFKTVTKQIKSSYLQLKKCPSSHKLNTKAVAHFATTLPSPPNSSESYTRQSEKTYACK